MMIKQGLYDPQFEHDNCGAGFICSLAVSARMISYIKHLIFCKTGTSRCSWCNGKTGDGAGILIDIPHDFLQQVCDFDLPDPTNYS